MKGKQIISAILCVILCAALFAGCGGKNNEPVNEPKEPEAPKFTVNPEDDGSVQTKELEVDENTKYADDLVLAAGEITVLNPINPAFSAASDGIIVASMIYDTLLARNPDGGYQPCLATEWSTEDYITWNLKLRDDVTFHNGEHFTADDVKFSIELAKEHSGTIPGSKWAKLDSVEIVNDYEVNLILSGKVVDFDDFMAHPMSAMWNRKAYEADPDAGMLVGTGPWKVEDFRASISCLLVANDEYWGEKPLAKTFLLKTVLEQTVRDIMFENGELDFTNIANTNVADFQNKDQFIVDYYVLSNTNYICFNLKDPLMADKNFRLAVAHAIDVQAMTDITLEGHGVTWDRGTYWGARTNYILSPEECPPLPRDLELAKEYLAKTAYAGEEIEIIASMPHSISNAQVFQQSMSEIGLNIKVFNTDNATMSSLTAPGSTSFQMLANSAAWTSLGSSINPIVTPGSAANKAQYNNPEILALLEKADETENGPEREELYHEVQRILAEDMPYLGTFNMIRYMGRQANCGGYVLWTDNYHDYSYAYKIIE